jgi:flagellar biosynthesis regulator FlaF
MSDESEVKDLATCLDLKALIAENLGPNPTELDAHNERIRLSEFFQGKHDEAGLHFPQDLIVANPDYEGKCENSSGVDGVDWLVLRNQAEDLEHQDRTKKNRYNEVKKVTDCLTAILDNKGGQNPELKADGEALADRWLELQDEQEKLQRQRMAYDKRVVAQMASAIESLDEEDRAFYDELRAELEVMCYTVSEQEEVGKGTVDDYNLLIMSHTMAADSLALSSAKREVQTLKQQLTAFETGVDNTVELTSPAALDIFKIVDERIR